MDRDDFKDFADNIVRYTNEWTEVCITGYFSETIRTELAEIGRLSKLKIICPEFPIKTKRDRRNLEVLRKLSNVKPAKSTVAEAGVEIRINNRLHARFLVAYDQRYPKEGGLLVIGSFDFNTECLGKERYDAGIHTRNPDLVKSAIKLFNEIWDDSSSVTLDKAFK
jgi:hypothetical protein